MALTQITAGGLADDSVDSDAYVNTSIDAAHLASGVAHGWKRLTSANADDDTEIDLETGIGATYDIYMIQGFKIKPVGNIATFKCRLKIDGSYKTDSSYSINVAIRDGTSTSYVAVASTTYDYIHVSGSATGSGSVETLEFWLYFYNPTATNTRKGIHGRTLQQYSGGGLRAGYPSGFYNDSAAALTGVRFLFSGGNIDSGHFALYGLVS